MYFQNNIKSLRDAEIVNILANRSEFSIEAVDAAYSEFELREIEHSFLEQATQIAQISQAEHLLRSEVPLNGWLKVLYFLFPLAMFAPLYYEKEGYDRKSKESRKSIILGFCFYVMLILLFSFNNRSKQNNSLEEPRQALFEQL